jgi:hypothetical protein
VPVVEPLMTDQRDLSGEVRLADRLALNVKEAAAAIGVSERHLRSILPATHFYFGRRLVFHVKRRNEWILVRTLACVS